MKIAMRFVLAGVLATGMGIVGVGSAQAAPGCTPAYACLWTGANYSGTSWGNSDTAGTFNGRHAGVNNAASSAWAYGWSCKYTTWYKNDYQSGEYFFLASQKWGEGAYKDSNLANGAGYGPYSRNNFDNTLSSYKFSACGW